MVVASLACDVCGFVERCRVGFEFAFNGLRICYKDKMLEERLLLREVMTCRSRIRLFIGLM